MKKIMCLIICLSILMLLCSCSSEKMKNAKLNGYGDDTFLGLLEIYAQEQIEEEYDYDANVKYKISYENGWDDNENLDDNTLNDDETAITYSLIVDEKTETGINRVTIKFFTVLFEESGFIEIKGLYLDEAGDVTEVYDYYEIQNIIEHIF